MDRPPIRNLPDPMPDGSPKRRKCGAKTRRGTPCEANAMPNGRCRMHGGKSLKGAAAPAFKTGRYSAYLPARLQGKYQESLADPELLALRDEIAVTDARIAELITKIDTGESGRLWFALKQAYGDLQASVNSGQALNVIAALQDMQRAIDMGTAESMTWAELSTWLEQRRRLVESERKRLVDMSQMIDSKEALLLVGAIVDIIRRNVTDRKVLSQITEDMQILLTKERTLTR